jgi:hypothetical protein
MATLILPPRLRRFTEGWRIANTSRGGGASLTGQQQFVVGPAGRWEAKLSLHCLDDDDYLEADGFLAGLDGSANAILCGPEDWRGRPWNIDPLTGTKITPNFAAQDIAVDPAFDTNPDTTGTLRFALAAPASMNATALSIQRIKGGALKRGQYLSIGQRLHIITGLTTADPTDPDSGLAIAGTIGVAVRPWLRLDYAAGTQVEFAKPVGLMRLTPDAAAMVERTTSPLSDLSLDLVEYL